MGEILKTVVKRGKSVRYGNSTAVQVLFCGHEFYVEGRKTLQDMQGFGFQGWIQAGDGIGEPDEFAAEPSKKVERTPHSETTPVRMMRSAFRAA